VHNAEFKHFDRTVVPIKSRVNHHVKRHILQTNVSDSVILCTVHCTEWPSLDRMSGQNIIGTAKTALLKSGEEAKETSKEVN
jgi:hypothetical protein